MLFIQFIPQMPFALLDIASLGDHLGLEEQEARQEAQELASLFGDRYTQVFPELSSG